QNATSRTNNILPIPEKPTPTRSGQTSLGRNQTRQRSPKSSVLSVGASRCDRASDRATKDGRTGTKGTFRLILLRCPSSVPFSFFKPLGHDSTHQRGDGHSRLAANGLQLLPVRLDEPQVDLFHGLDTINLPHDLSPSRLRLSTSN